MFCPAKSGFFVGKKTEHLNFDNSIPSRTHFQCGSFCGYVDGQANVSLIYYRDIRAEIIFLPKNKNKNKIPNTVLDKQCCEVKQQIIAVLKIPFLAHLLGDARKDQRGRMVDA